MSQPSMFRQVFSLSRDSVIYGISVVLSQLVGFLLIPVYTRRLGTTGYGVIEVLSTVGSVLGIVLALGFTTAVLRFYAARENEEDKRTVVSTAVFFLGAVALAALVLLELAAGSIAELIFRHPGTFTYVEYTKFFRIVFVSLFLNEGISMALTVFRARGEPTNYAMASVTQFLMAVTLNLVFVVWRRWGVMGVLYAEVITAGSLYVVLMSTLIRRVGIRLSAKELKAMLSYGLPLVPAGLGGWMLVMADRWILNWLKGSSLVGVYSLGYKFGMVIQGILVGPIQLAWLPFLFATARQGKSKETYTRVFTYFLLAALLLGLVLSALGEELVTLMADPDFHDAYKVIPLVALSYVLYGCYFQMAAGIYLEGKTKYMALLMGVGAVVNVALNLALIGPYGIMGSAVATLIAYALLPVGAYVLSQRYYPIEYEWGRVVKMILAVAVIYAGCLGVAAAVRVVRVEAMNDDSILQTYETWTWTCTYTTTQADIDNASGADGTIDSTAAVHTEQLGDRSDSKNVPVTQEAGYAIDLTVTGVGNDGPDGSVDAAGDKIEYQVVVTNTGNMPLTGVKLSDSLVDVSGVVPAASLNDDDVLDTSENWTWTYRYEVTEEDKETDGGGDNDIDNTATVSSNEMGNRSDSEDVPMATKEAACTIHLEVIDVAGDGPDGSVDAVGDVITYEVVVSNTGGVPLTGVSLTDSHLGTVGVVPVQSGSAVSAPLSRILISGALKVALILTYPILLYGLRFFRPDEVELAKQAVKSAPATVARVLRRKRPSS